jgi:hypothetical protein
MKTCGSVGFMTTDNSTHETVLGGPQNQSEHSDEEIISCPNQELTPSHVGYSQSP